MITRNWRKPAVLAVTAALALAACGDDDNGGAATTGAAPATTAGGAATTAATTAETTATTGGTETTAGGTETTTGGTETTTGGSAGGGGEFGLIAGKYTHGDLTLDPADCPEDWNPKQGITDTEIKFFESLPTSGPLAGFGLIGDGMKSYFTYINQTEGGVAGKKITLDTKDDGYVPDKTKTNVDEALGANKYAGMVTIVGTPNNLAVWDELNNECMPQMLNGTGAPEWGDVTNHPWTSGMQLDYASEARRWAEWLKAEHPEVTKVAALNFNNDFGNGYVKYFGDAIKGSGIQVVEQQSHEPTAPDLTNQLTTIAASGAQAVLLETSGAFCVQAMAGLEKNTSFKPIVIMSSTCGSLGQFFKPLIGQGLSGAGTNIIHYVKDPNDSAFKNDEAVKLFKQIAGQQGLDTTQSTYFTGWVFAWYLVNILKTAATYQGGLDRGNIALAARFIDAKNPMIMDGIVQQTNGDKDAYLIEGGQMAEYTVPTAGQLGTFKAVGNLPDNNGKMVNFEEFSKGG
jgi:branched-chain amino acid transport system substrate-binding protein